MIFCSKNGLQLYFQMLVKVRKNIETIGNFWTWNTNYNQQYQCIMWRQVPFIWVPTNLPTKTLKIVSASGKTVVPLVLPADIIFLSFLNYNWQQNHIKLLIKSTKISSALIIIALLATVGRCSMLNDSSNLIHFPYASLQNFFRTFEKYSLNNVQAYEAYVWVNNKD